MPQGNPEVSLQGAVHLVLGDAAAGCLRASWRFPGARPGEMPVFRDVLALGPLARIGTPDEAASRAAYWQDVMPDAHDYATELAAEAGRYGQAAQLARQGAELTVWHGDHASSVLWLQRLAVVLPAEAQAELIDASRAPFANHPGAIRALGQVPPARVAELQGLTFTLSPEALRTLAGQWRENASRPSELRRSRDGRIAHHAADFYDPLLLARCGADWRPAPRVVGEAMEEADEFLGDWFFARRLRRLAEAGRLTMQGGYGEDLDFQVRLP
jgi:hypothetical protein